MPENEESETIRKIKTLMSSESTMKGLFIASVASISALFSFSYALTSVKKRDNTKYDAATVELYESGSKLAVRALKWGSLYAVTGCGLIMFCVWQLSGARNKEEFRMKLGSLLPTVPKNYPPQSRTEFASVTEFMQYLDDEYSTNKPMKSENAGDASDTNT